MFPFEHSLVQLYEAPQHVYFVNLSLSEWILKLHSEVLNRLQQACFDGVANRWWVVLNNMLDVYFDELVKLRLVPGLITQPAQSSLLTSWFKGGKACHWRTLVNGIPSHNHFNMQSGVSLRKLWSYAYVRSQLHDLAVFLKLEHVEENRLLLLN